MKKKMILGIAIALSALMVLGGCAKQASETVVIKATDNGWDSQKLHNEIAKFIVDSAYDNYDFQLSTGS